MVRETLQPILWRTAATAIERTVSLQEKWAGRENGDEKREILREVVVPTGRSSHRGRYFREMFERAPLDLPVNCALGEPSSIGGSKPSGSAGAGIVRDSGIAAYQKGRSADSSRGLVGGERRRAVRQCKIAKHKGATGSGQGGPPIKLTAPRGPLRGELHLP
jgi:hypothetical protein